MKFLRTPVASFILLSLAFAFIYMPWLKFPWKFGCIALLTLALTYLQSGSIKPMQLKKIGSDQFLIALGLFAALELMMDFVVQPGLTRALHEPANYSGFSTLHGDINGYLKFLVFTWISAAIGEEFLFRGFAILQLGMIFNKNNVVNVVLSAVLFSLPHLYQGITGLITTFLFGLALGWIFVKFKNLWINVIVHGLIDTLFLTLAYLGLLSWYN
ncbi:MAG: CPBP family intramembrane metalloprotease [Chitinophagaceae bacterium]|nr:MAG: CPBP family intramembrane metalloprotease [Chitinophagaceae bacterium]